MHYVIIPHIFLGTLNVTIHMQQRELGTISNEMLLIESSFNYIRFMHYVITTCFVSVKFTKMSRGKHPLFHLSAHSIVVAISSAAIRWYSDNVIYASTPKRGNLFQTNQPVHESDDRATDTVT